MTMIGMRQRRLAITAAVFLCSVGTARAGKTFDCVMEPAQKVKIGSAVTGVLKIVPVQRGDSIKAGQTIAELDDSVEIANLALATTQAKSSEVIAAQQARVKLAKDRLDRATPLELKNIVSRDKLEGFQADYEIATRELNTEVVKHHLAEIEAQRAKATLALRQIKSPLNGIVMDKTLLPGEFVNQEASIMTLVQIDPLYIEAYLPVAYYKMVKAGMKGMIYPDDPIGGTYEAPITVVDHVFDAASGTFQVRLELRNENNALPAGVRCRVDLAFPAVDLSGTRPSSPLLSLKPEGTP